MTGRAGGPGEVVLTDPTPAEARAAVRAAGTSTATYQLELAVTEVVTNALEHGRPPVEVVLHRTPGAITVTVRDRGSGPDEPVAPRAPEVALERGRGRWLAHHLVDVVERRVPSGYEVQLTAGQTATEGDPVTEPGTWRG